MRRIDEPAELDASLDAGVREPLLLAELDLPDLDAGVAARVPRGSVFLNCHLGAEAAEAATAAGASVLHVPPVPYDRRRRQLYTPDELYAGFDPTRPASYADTLDARIHRHWGETGGSEPEPAEALSRRLHDHHVTVALHEWLGPREVVAVMGGHGLARTDVAYRDVAVLGRDLARAGLTVATGGGPGAMEAAHLGARLGAGDPADDDARLDRALALLAPAPRYTDERWLAAAFSVMAEVLGPTPSPTDARSVGVPTWFYGHEPPTPFAPVIAKYFENSLREDGLVTIAERGIVFAEGSAGTIQEIFQDAAQNHYGTIGGVASPMVLLGSAHWTDRYPVAPLLERMVAGRANEALVRVVDGPAEAVDFLLATSPVPVPAP